MKNFHQFLDHIFKKRLSFSVFFRIWFAFGLVIVLASTLAIYQLQKTIKPSAQRVVEDTLVDISRILAVSLRPAVVSGQIYQRDFQQDLAQSFAPYNPTQPNFPVWYDQKTQSQLHVYITNQKGVVIYDSQNQAVGKDFSRWNDVYLTLQGKYGARSSKQNPMIADSSVMYVASPILNQNGELIGVVSVGKPVLSLLPYINLSRDEILKTMLYVAGLGLLFTGLMAWWLRYSIQTINRYTQNLASTPPPHFYLGKELNELGIAINEMKNTIENKAYVTDYVHTLTHELKSPLTAIRASGELLGDDLPAKHREQFSQTILQQSEKLQTFVEKLLVIAKLEQPNFKLNQHHQAINPIIRATIHNQQAWIQQKNLTVIQDFDDNVMANVDKFWLEQALQNILDNAIKFANQVIIIQLKNDKNQIEINVLNDSQYLPDYVIQKAFERYFSIEIIEIMENHAQHQQQKSVKGTGLGLTLVKQVIDRHAGSITFSQISADKIVLNHNNFDEFLSNNPNLQNFVKIQILLPKTHA